MTTQDLKIMAADDDRVMHALPGYEQALGRRARSASRCSPRAVADGANSRRRESGTDAGRDPARVLR
ncbi:MAG: hypothetical protein HY778_03855 [Betaproteobacteria bacterium]|nr:hypothetical protein [Betaproteobacteria bacterium]